MTAATPLHCASPSAWVDCVINGFDQFLLDHAAAEQALPWLEEHVRVGDDVVLRSGTRPGQRSRDHDVKNEKSMCRLIFCNCKEYIKSLKGGDA